MESFSIVAWLVHTLDLPESWAENYVHCVMSVAVLFILTVGSFFAWKKLKSTEEMIVPEKRVTFVNVIEFMVESLLGLMESTIGKDAKKHLPLIGALFFYILVSNLIGIIPGFTPPTDNVNTNAACAIVVFLYYNYCGIKKHGIVKYLRHLGGPIIYLAPFLFLVEMISHVVRPCSLSIRLFGNITGDHMVLSIFSNLVPIGVPIIFQAMALLVSFIQAFVFVLLSMIYISMATASEEQ